MLYEADQQRLEGLTGDQRTVQEAKLRWHRSKDWQSSADKYFIDDTRFANADAYNHDQWPGTMWDQRSGPSGDDRPSLTINKTRVHNRMLINESMKNKSSIKVRPTAGEASKDGAEAMQALIRHVENISKATIAYRTAIRHQVEGGIGYVSLGTKWVSNKSKDQDIVIQRIRDPLLVYLDPDISEPDGLDANWGFLFERMSREKFNKQYPSYKDKVGQVASAPLGFGIEETTWLDDDNIVVAMYYKKEGKKDKFVSYVVPESGERIEKLLSEIREESGDELADALIYDIDQGRIDGDYRDTTDDTVKWYHIAGDTIMSRGTWAGKYIPIIRCVGDESVINGIYDRKGLTRYLIDAQRMLNYNASAAIEFGALQTKVPYIGPARAFEGQEQWKTANKKNYAFLAFNDLDEEAPPDAQVIAPPQKVQPPSASPLYMQGMQDAERQMMMVSGQWQAQLGEQDEQSASSGKAINERQRQSDTATYDFVEHQGDMYRAIGIQLLDLIPKIYDTERLLKVLDEKNEEILLQIKPTAPFAAQTIEKDNEEATLYQLNPNIGEYEAIADVGPDYATQRQEAWNALSQILVQNNALQNVASDLLFQYGDFPGADDIAERLKKWIMASNPAIFSDDPNAQAANVHIQKLTQLNTELVQKLAAKELLLQGKEQLRDIEAFKAETGRMDVRVKALEKLLLNEHQKAELEHELEVQGREHVYTMVQQENEAALAPKPTNGSGE